MNNFRKEYQDDVLKLLESGYKPTPADSEAVNRASRMYVSAWVAGATTASLAAWVTLRGRTRWTGTKTAGVVVRPSARERFQSC